MEHGTAHSGTAPSTGVPQFEAETLAVRRLQVLSVDAELAVARHLRINPTDLSAMGHLAATTNPLGPSELSHRLGISPGATTEVVDRLEEAGHLKRERDSSDRRRVHLKPSPQAIAAVMRTIEPLTSDLDSLAHRFSPAERDVIRRYLDGAIDIYQQFVKGP